MNDSNWKGGRKDNNSISDRSYAESSSESIHKGPLGSGDVCSADWGVWKAMERSFLDRGIGSQTRQNGV